MGLLTYQKLGIYSQKVILYITCFALKIIAGDTTSQIHLSSSIVVALCCFYYRIEIKRKAINSNLSYGVNIEGRSDLIPSIHPNSW